MLILFYRKDLEPERLEKGFSALDSIGSTVIHCFDENRLRAALLGVRNKPTDQTRAFAAAPAIWRNRHKVNERELIVRNGNEHFVRVVVGRQYLARNMTAWAVDGDLICTFL